MSNLPAWARGLIYLGIFVAFIFVALYFIPFVLMANAGVAVALPVIEVPGETVIYDFPVLGKLTNTTIGTVLASLVVLLFAGLAWRSSNGWTKEVPGPFQAWVETLVEALWNITKLFAGESDRVKNVLFPVASSIFIFLFAGNMMHFFPGVDSVGVIHCAYAPTQSGYPRNGSQLYNDTPLFSGTTVTFEEEHACEEVHYANEDAPDYDPAVEDEINAVVDRYTAAVDDAGGVLGDAELANFRAEYEALTGYHLPIYFLTAEQLERGMLPYSYVITPFVRVGATDINLTLGLALFSFVLIQYFGLATLGPEYLQKFINLPALGNAGKRPLGAVDFVVGLFEIISEFAKIVSLAFRLFGAIFAGMVVLFVIAFLVGTFLPVVFYGLELIVGFAQAAVFAALTIVFSAQAMVSHHHDDEHDHEHAEAH